MFHSINIIVMFCIYEFYSKIMILSAKYPIKPFKGQDYNHNMAKMNCISLWMKLLLLLTR